MGGIFQLDTEFFEESVAERTFFSENSCQKVSRLDFFGTAFMGDINRGSENFPCIQAQFLEKKRRVFGVLCIFHEGFDSSYCIFFHVFCQSSVFFLLALFGFAFCYFFANSFCGILFRSEWIIQKLFDHVWYQ